MTDSGNYASTLTRLSSGIPGLDTILQGGFFAGSLYIVRGAPGTGKTILTNQVIFHTVRAGGGRRTLVCWAKVIRAYSPTSNR